MHTTSLDFYTNRVAQFSFSYFLITDKNCAAALVEIKSSGVLHNCSGFFSTRLTHLILTAVIEQWQLSGYDGPLKIATCHFREFFRNLS